MTYDGCAIAVPVMIVGAVAARGGTLGAGVALGSGCTLDEGVAQWLTCCVDPLGALNCPCVWFQRMGWDRDRRHVSEVCKAPRTGCT
jgi:hypothetical protein